MLTNNRWIRSWASTSKPSGKVYSRCLIFCHVRYSESPWNANRPAIIWYMMHPRAQKSELAIRVSSRCARGYDSDNNNTFCSFPSPRGAQGQHIGQFRPTFPPFPLVRNKQVERHVELRKGSLPVSRIFPVPKSVIFIRKSLSRRRFSGLRSLGSRVIKDWLRPHRV